jgi:hypothetical protein
VALGATPSLTAAVGASLATLADTLGATLRPVDTLLVFIGLAGILVRLSGSPASVSGEKTQTPKY